MNPLAACPSICTNRGREREGLPGLAQGRRLTTTDSKMSEGRSGISSLQQEACANSARSQSGNGNRLNEIGMEMKCLWRSV